MRSVAPHSQPPGVGEAIDVAGRDDLFVSVGRRCLRDLGASAVGVHLKVPGEPTLAAAVVVVAPLGMIAVERLSLDDPVFATVRAYETGRICTAHSYEVAARHLELGVYAASPHIITAAPLTVGERRVGALTVYSPRAGPQFSESERERLRQAAETLSAGLDRLPSSADPLRPPKLPLVVAPQDAADAAAGELWGSPREAPGSPDPWSAPLLFHLHKLTISLMSVVHTRDAIALTIERLVSGFRAQAVAIGLIEGDRLHVLGARGCPKEYLKALNGIALSTASPETEAIARQTQIVYEAGGSGQWPGWQSGVIGDGRDAHVWVVLPLVAGGHAVGVCSVALASEFRAIATGLSPLSTLATLLGQTLERTQLYDAGHILAQKLQHALLPRTLPQLAGVPITSRYEPPAGAIELGGDWYDVITLPDGGIAAVIGDVEGHSTEAAVVMGQLRAAVRGHALAGYDPCTVLDRTNCLLLDLDTGLFATCVCVWLDPDTGTAQVVTAGHPRPLIRAADGTYLPAVADIGVPLGVEANPSYRAGVHVLPPQTLLVLYTNGLSGPAEELRRETLEAALASSGGQLETLGDHLMGSAERSPRADDAALLLLRYEGPSTQAKQSVRQLHLHRHDYQGVRHTRQFLAACLDSWHLDALSDSAEVLVSEVVTNALLHGDSDVDVCLRKYPDHFRVEVRDSDPHPAMLVDLGADEDKAEGGRGLVIVSALTSAWGNSPSGRGKTVWFEMDIPEPY